jgi:hypothetical protein
MSRHHGQELRFLFQSQLGSFARRPPGLQFSLRRPLAVARHGFGGNAKPLRHGNIRSSIIAGGHNRRPQAIEMPSLIFGFTALASSAQICIGQPAGLIIIRRM